MHLCKTKENHFVPRFYLKSFLNSSKEIYLFDKNENKLHKTKNLKEICCKKNLYTITEKISKNDVEWFKKVVSLSDDDVYNEYLRILVCFLNDELANLFYIEMSDKEHQIKLNNEIKEILNEKISRNQELLFSFYENDFRKIYEKILKENRIDFLSSSKGGVFFYKSLDIIQFVYQKLSQKMKIFIEKYFKEKQGHNEQDVLKDLKKNDYYDFWHYIIIQYFRTESIIKLFSLSNDEQKKLKRFNINTENVMFLIIHFQILNILENLIHEDFKLILIKNKTETDFITSDNPAVNPYSYIIKDGKLLNDEFEIYFPLSQKLAILCSKNFLHKNYDKVKSELSITESNEIDFWNKLILRKATRYIYATSETTIKIYNPTCL